MEENRLLDESDMESNHSDGTVYTDVAIRCGVAVVHDRGSDIAHVTTVNKYANELSNWVDREFFIFVFEWYHFCGKNKLKKRCF